MNLDEIKGLTKDEAVEYIKIHAPGLRFRVVLQDGVKVPIWGEIRNALNVEIEDDFITSAYIT